MATPLKDLYTREWVASLAASLKAAHGPFDESAFQRRVFARDWASLELKQRMRRISTAMHDTLDLPYPKALKVVCAAAPSHGGFMAMCFPDFVEVHGQHDAERSLQALHWLTRFSSSEFAIRPFLLADTQGVMKALLDWSQDENEHVRRWCSEGCRPRLPWGMAVPALKRDPSLILPILERLKADPSEYVRRSVANNLNDISKDHPDLVVELARRWTGQNAETDKLLRHATRTLLKRGRQDALGLFGVAGSKHLKVQHFSLGARKLKLGDSTTFSASVKNTGPKAANLRLEYCVHFVKANGSSSPKVFQIGERSLAPGESWEVERRHKFADLTTRTHHQGEHVLALHVNGEEKARESLHLKV